MFDSPFEFCKRCREYVLLDQTQRECMREHHCAEGSGCPLRRYFTGIEFARDGEGATDPGARKPHGAAAQRPPAARRPKT
jgi:hypothetical protein